jgi:hypothetical protein
MARDVDVRGAHLRAGGEVRQRERHVDVVRHQVQHALVETAHRMAQQAAQVGLAPGVGIGGKAASAMEPDGKAN